MTRAEWESLCDGCGRCCLHKLRDEETDALAYTEVACRLLDLQTCRCSDYAERKKRVPDCVKLTPKRLGKIDWLPPTCAYRVLSEGRDLAWWHPLVSGDPETVHLANASARNKTRPEGRLKMAGLIKRITPWPAPLEKPPKGYRKKKKR